MTLTTERQQFEAWFTNKFPRSYWGVEKTTSGEYQGGLAAPLWEAWQENRRGLTNREAQPVAVVISRGNLAHVTDCDLELGTKLYTAPPAPAVPEEARVGEMPFLGNSEQGYVRGWNDCRAAMLESVAATSSIPMISDGYKFPDGWIACSEQMPELDKRVLLYFDSYDGHIEDGCIGDDGDGPYHYFFDGDSLQQEPTHWMPLPAAPEVRRGDA